MTTTSSELEQPLPRSARPVDAPKRRRLPFSWRAGCVCVIIHTLFLGRFATVMSEGLSTGRADMIAWMLWWMIDFPSSLISLFPGTLRTHWNPTHNPEVTNFLNAIEHLVLGGLQYFILTGIVVGLLKRWLTPLPSESKSDPTGQHTSTINGP